MLTAQLDPRDPESRIARLLDGGKFEFLIPRTDCGMVAVTGDIKGNKVVVFASDATIKSGALGVEGSKVIVTAYKAAMGAQVPIIGIWHSGGARLSDGVASLDAFGEVFQSMISASGRIPQLSLVLGPTAGGGAYGPALTDIVVLSPEGRIFVTGPDVVKSVTGEDTDMALLGGPEAHRKNSGLAHIIAADEDEAITDIRTLTDLFANQGFMNAEVKDIDLAAFVPQSKVRTYEVHPLVEAILDTDAEHIELLSMWAPNMTTIIGRLGGATVGVLANNPAHIAGVLDAAAGEKAARFVRTCDAFGIPLIVIADVQGFLPGAGQEWEGAVRRGAKLLHAFGEAVVPRVTLITRRAYGGAYVAMNSKALGATRVFAWPEAEVSVMGAVAAVRVLHRRILADLPAEQRESMELELAAEHEKISGGVTRAVEIGAVDEIIEPAKTRSALAKVIAQAPHRRGAHGNIPL
ncbi:COG4799 Acetyl-CoA carboxylase, carboxyltransferase component (subunits alpha and beta) [Candidatus Planktophila vernalis]|uniref:acyl-CoA carboxylase subunit beta n=1 Tax=Candidatus Planktophila vernalis TaxID=1884907 RepID=UPI003CE783E5